MALITDFSIIREACYSHLAKDCLIYHKYYASCSYEKRHPKMALVGDFQGETIRSSYWHLAKDNLL